MPFCRRPRPRQHTIFLHFKGRGSKYAQGLPQGMYVHSVCTLYSGARKGFAHLHYTDQYKYIYQVTKNMRCSRTLTRHRHAIQLKADAQSIVYVQSICQEGRTAWKHSSYISRFRARYLLRIQIHLENLASKQACYASSPHDGSDCTKVTADGSRGGSPSCGNCTTKPNSLRSPGYSTRPGALDDTRYVKPSCSKLLGNHGRFLQPALNVSRRHLSQSRLLLGLVVGVFQQSTYTWQSANYMAFQMPGKMERRISSDLPWGCTNVIRLFLGIRRSEQRRWG